MTTDTKCHCNERLAPVEHWRQHPTAEGFEIDIQFSPGYNCELRGPGRHGVCGMEIRWYLRGPKGVAQFAVYTDWIPGELRPGHGRPPVGYPPREPAQYPRGVDLGYHAIAPQYEEQESMGCDLLPTGRCFYDGSGLNAVRLARRFTDEGEQAVWDELMGLHDGLEQL